MKAQSDLNKGVKMFYFNKRRHNIKRCIFCQDKEISKVFSNIYCKLFWTIFLSLTSIKAKFCFEKHIITSFIVTILQREDPVHINPLTVNTSKWSNKSRQAPTNCLSVLDISAGLALKELNICLDCKLRV